MGRSALRRLLLRCACAVLAASESSEVVGGREGLLNVALHAQAYPADGGVIVGSVMTTNGLKRALLRSGRVRVARSFYPFHYNGLDAETWDVLLIEGWFEMSTHLIHEVRRQSPSVVVLYWCLDPHFPGLDAIGAIDVDGYLTNSRSVARRLAESAPVEVVNLAADLEAMAVGVGVDGWSEEDARDRGGGGGPLVYVGSALGIETKANLVAMLREAAASEVGLELWGSGWGAIGPEDLRPHYRGILPQGDLARCYAKATAVIGATMDGQREAGMVNNRVFEALATGTPLIMESFPELEDEFAGLPRAAGGDDDDAGAALGNLLLWRSSGDVAVLASRVASRDAAEAADLGRRTRAYVREFHSYDARASQVLAFVDDVRRAKVPHCARTGCLRVAVVWSGEWTPQFGSSIATAVDVLVSSYAIFWVHASETHAYDLLAYDAVWAVGRLGSPADVAVRKLTLDFTLLRRLHQRRLLIVIDDPSSSPNPGEGDVDRPKPAPCDADARPPRPPRLVYDAVVFPNGMDRAVLRRVGFRDLALHEGFGVSLPANARADPPLPLRGPSPRALVLADAALAAVDDDAAHVAAVANGLLVDYGSVAIAVVDETVRASHVRRLARRLDGGVELHLVGHDAACDGGDLQGLAAAADLIHLPWRRNSTKTDWGAVFATGYAKPGAAVRGDPDNARLARLLAADTKNWDRVHYANQIAFAMTRALTLGRAASAIAFTAPPNGTVVADDGRETVDLVLPTETVAFNVGREGSWCVAVNGQIVTCVLQHHLTLVLRLTRPTDCDLQLRVYAELKSNIYADVITKSDTLHLTLNRRTRRNDTAHTTDDTAPAYPSTEYLLWPHAPTCPRSD